MTKPPEILPSSIPVPAGLVQTSAYAWFYLRTLFEKVPGTRYIVSYVKKSHQDDPYRTMVEIVLIIYGIVYFLGKPRKKGVVVPGSGLSAREVEALLEEWEPEPLVERVPDDQKWRLNALPRVVGGGIVNQVRLARGATGNTSDENGADHVTFNCASHNALQLTQHPEVVAVAEETIRRYGVGACGPAGFYGNQDVHSRLEYDMARFFGTESAVLYGQDFCVAPSVVPAFTKRGDVIVADDQVNVSLQNALQLSRSTVYYFKHNDMDSLEELLIHLQERELQENLPALPRKFIVTEGLFHRLGDIAPLPDLVRLKNKYRYRLFVDETFSIGVLGATGRGVTEHFNMARSSSIDITTGSLATAMGSSGGFVLGDDIMSKHQRIGSFAYCYSASLPSYTVAAVSKVIELLENGNDAVAKLHALSDKLHVFFSQDKALSKYIQVTSDPASYILHFRLTPEFRLQKFNSSEEQIFQERAILQKKGISEKHVEAYELEDRFLQCIVDTALHDSNVYICRSTYIYKHETLPIVPSIKICCNATMSEKELLDACNAVKQAVLKNCV
ncbi:LAMI_0F15808g1_1 [Lachancea mirantina]|uniref:serine C-palmitoyltransferase n=1 Tax=Lachancea mirantina TaxID=1230905 RepID=A0A1G4K4I8_9SACH|nr:LAMI_0F15808g1_1 [Lachancea mirantina]